MANRPSSRERRAPSGGDRSGVPEWKETGSCSVTGGRSGSPKGRRPVVGHGGRPTGSRPVVGHGGRPTGSRPVVGHGGRPTGSRPVVYRVGGGDRSSFPMGEG